MKHIGYFFLFLMLLLVLTFTLCKRNIKRNEIKLYQIVIVTLFIVDNVRSG